MSKPDWESDEVNTEYLVNSGLLFEINRQILHPIGVALTVKNGVIGFKDFRESPEEIVFDKATLESGRTKFVEFMKSFGNKQLTRRRKKLGQAVQFVCPSW